MKNFDELDVRCDVPHSDNKYSRKLREIVYINNFFDLK